MIQHNIPFAELQSALRGVRDLITDPSRWTTRAGARDAEGYPTYWMDPDATCWCALGAIAKTIGDRSAIADAATHYLARFASPNLVKFNDTHTHAEVLALFDRAIAALGEGKK